jgi:aminoglycoside phosphotransferase (APT) family kinase protein
MATIRSAVGLPATHPIEFFDGGWDSRVYTFDNGQHFFKFPRSQKIQHRYQYEIDALTFAETLDTDIRTPRIKWRDPHNAYFGYEGVQGQILMDSFMGLELADKQRIGRAIGSFLAQFHTLELPGARTRTVEDEIEQMQRWFGEHSPAFTQNLSPAEYKLLQSLAVTSWPAELRALGSDMVLCHGDLHFGNVLLDQDGQVGIIDFGDVAYCDRSRDFIDYEDPTILQATLETYDHNDELFQKRLAIRQKFGQIVNIGFFYGKQDAAGLANAVGRMQQLLALESRR